MSSQATTAAVQMMVLTFIAIIFCATLSIVIAKLITTPIARIGKINEQSRGWRPNHTRTSVQQLC